MKAGLSVDLWDISLEKMDIAKMVHLCDATELSYLHFLDGRKYRNHGIVDPDVDRANPSKAAAGFHRLSIA
jgi:hypothetical protein